MESIKEAWELHKLHSQKIAPLLTKLEEAKAKFHYSDGCGAGVSLLLHFIMATFDEGLSKKAFLDFVDKLIIEGSKITQQTLKEMKDEN